MNKTPFIHLLILHLSITLLSSHQSAAQKVITDTFTYYSFGEYCEGISFCEYLVPDSTYHRLNGKAPDLVNGQFNYAKFCHPLGYDDKGELYGYKDFDLIIGTERFEYSFPQYCYYLKTDVLLNSISELQLYNFKTKETLTVEKYTITYDNEVYDLPEQQQELVKCLKSSKRDQLIKVEIASRTYPNNDQMCGKVKMDFHAMSFRLK